MKKNGISVLGWIYLVLLSAIILALGLSTFIYMRIYFTQLPAFDSIAIVGFLDRSRHNLTIYQYILEEHNEHRIFLTKIILLMDFYLFHGKKIFPLVVLSLCNFGIFFSIVRIFWNKNKYIAGLLICTLFSLFFTLTQLRNFDSVFQLQFFIVNASVIGSFYYFSLHARKLSTHGQQSEWIYFFAAWLCSGFASFNMANGLFSTIVLCLACLVFSKWRYFFISLVLSILIWFVYFKGYTPPGGSHSHDIAFNLSTLWEFLLYYVFFLGNIFNLESTHHWFVYFFGISGLILGSSLILVTLFPKRERSSLPIFVALVILFVFISIAGAAYGRIHSGYKQALTGRYATTSILFWSVLLGSLLYHFGAHKMRIVRGSVFGLLAVIILTIGIRQVQLAKALVIEGEKRDIGEVSLQAGIIDTAILRKGLPGYERRIINTLKKERLSIFSSKEYQKLGKAAWTGEAPPTGDDFVLLQLIKTYKEKDFGSRGMIFVGGIRGSIKDRQFPVVNRSNEICGYGLVVKNIDLFLDPSLRSSDFDHYCFVAVSVGEEEIDSLRVVSQEPKGKTMLHRIVKEGWDSILLGNFETCGELIQISGGWFEKGLYAELDVDNPATPIYGTWDHSKGDQNTGKIEIGIDFPANPNKSEIFLPVLLGPDASQCSVQLVSESSELIYNIPINGLSGHQWVFVKLNKWLSNGKNRFVVVDEGANWGQWIAIGLPVVVTK